MLLVFWLIKTIKFYFHIKVPEPPDNCCMSGCANCVWITYAETINQMYRDGGKTARKLILERMEDPSMKAFLTLELNISGKKN